MNTYQWQTAPPQPIRRRVVVQQAGAVSVEPVDELVVMKPIEWPVPESINPYGIFVHGPLARGPPDLSITHVPDRCVVHGGFLLDEEEYDVILANVGDEELVAELSKRSTHGIGTKQDGTILKW